MKNYIFILIVILVHVHLKSWAQTLAPACTESWVRYAATPDKNYVPDVIYMYEWILDNKNILDSKIYGNGDSIDIRWGNIPGLAQIGIIQHNIYKEGTFEHHCSGNLEIAYVNISGVMVNIEDAIACVGDSLNFFDDMGNATSYRWNDTLIADKFNYYASKADTIKVWVRGTSASGCTSSDTANVYIYPNPLVDITLNGKAVSDTALVGIDPVRLNAGDDGVFYSWSTGEISPEINVLPIDPSEPDTMRYYTVTVKNTFDCKTSDSIRILRPEPPSAKNVPMAITPNGDGKNDIWEIPFLKSYKNADVTVYDRWGNIVFTNKGLYKEWDGKYNGEAVPMGTYYYIIKVNGNVKPIIGNVMVIR